MVEQIHPCGYVFWKVCVDVCIKSKNRYVVHVLVEEGVYMVAKVPHTVKCPNFREILNPFENYVNEYENSDEPKNVIDTARSTKIKYKLVELCIICNEYVVWVKLKIKWKLYVWNWKYILCNSSSEYAILHVYSVFQCFKSNILSIKYGAVKIIRETSKLLCGIRWWAAQNILAQVNSRVQQFEITLK